MFKLKSKRQPREMFIMFFVLAVAIFLYQSRIYKPKTKALLDSASKTAALTDEVKLNQVVILELKDKVGDINKKVELAQNDKPTKLLSELIDEINAKEGGVRVNSYTSKDTPVENSILSVNLDLELESTFLDLATMIERLEEKYKFLEFKRVETTKVDDFLQKCKSSVSLSVYLDKEKR